MNVGDCASLSTIQYTRKWPEVAAQIPCPRCQQEKGMPGSTEQRLATLIVAVQRVSAGSPLGLTAICKVTPRRGQLQKLAPPPPQKKTVIHFSLKYKATARAVFHHILKK